MAELDELAARTTALRQQADVLDSLLQTAPVERARLSASLDEARAERDERQRSVAEARDELAAAEGGRDEERLAEARRLIVRVEDALAMADRRVTTAAETLADHERRVEAARSEAAAVEAAAEAFAAALHGRPGLAPGAGEAPGSGLEEVSRWATAARAALFVARGNVRVERDGVIRQANELASAMLGEPIAAGSVAVVRRQLERRVGG
ncbi:MAG: hypothetical protein U0R69_03965 [Gaiellales bacterium]